MKSVCREYMKAAFLVRFGDNEKLEIAEIPKPRIEKNDVLIRVLACSLNPIDLRNQASYGKTLKVFFKNKHQHDIFPLILGRDGSGVIEAIGSKVSRFKPGDEVWFSSPFWQQGHLTEYTCIKEIYVTRKPFNLTHVQAASIPYVALTAWNALVAKAKLSPSTTTGKRVLIHAGTGGIGSFAIQLIKAWGGHVTTTCSSDAEDFVKKLGADDVVDYRKDIVANLKMKQKFDVVLNTLVQHQDEITLDVCKRGGHVTSIISPMVHTLDTYGLILGGIISVYLMLKVIIVQKLYRGINYSWSFYKPTLNGLETVRELCEQNKISPVLDKVFSLNDINEGITHLKTGHARGKTVITIKQ